MNWKKIIKMPVPIDTEQRRDKDYTQAITEYEKTVIEPQITTLLQQQMAGGTHDFTIQRNDEEMEDSITHVPFGYAIGWKKKQELGNNLNFIIKVISEIYKNEGWEVDWPNGMNGDKIVMSQPEGR